MNWNGSGSLTIHTNTNAATTFYQSPYTVYPSGGQQFVPAFQFGLPPSPSADTPEAWLRQRVKEVCELAEAA